MKAIGFNRDNCANLFGTIAAFWFAEENMLVEHCLQTDWFVVDRGPMRDSKNMHNRYQLTSPDQKLFKVYRKKNDAIKALEAITAAHEAENQLVQVESGRWNWYEEELQLADAA